jgi:hypothetical protein
MAEAAGPCNQALGNPLNLVFRAYRYYFPEISVIQGVVVMRSVMNSVIFSAWLAGAAFAVPSTAAFAAAQDGNWSVLIITEKGECDPAYRYAVKVANRQVSYAGDASLDMAGTIAPNGAVKVSIRLGDKGANGTDRLSGQTGAGTWHGAGANTTCAGRWEAEKR